MYAFLLPCITAATSMAQRHALTTTDALAESIARENRRRAYLEQQMQIQRELGKDQAEIDALQKQLAETNAKMAAMGDAQKQQQAK